MHLFSIISQKNIKLEMLEKSRERINDYCFIPDIPRMTYADTSTRPKRNQPKPSSVFQTIFRAIFSSHSYLFV